MKKVLIIAYNFPPINNVGIHRFLRIGRWFPEFRWQPVILTAKHPISGNYDKENDIFEKKYFTKVYRYSSIFDIIIAKLSDLNNRSLIGRLYRSTIRNLFLPDDKIIWSCTTLFKASIICKKEGIDLIIVTMNPFSTGILAVLLKKLTKIPLILDYRDPWTISAYYESKLPFQKSIEILIDKNIIKYADYITTTSESMSQHFINSHYVEKNKIQSITNSYDLELQHINNNYEVTSLNKEKINLTYVGNFYGLRQPYNLLTGLRLFFKKYPYYIKRINVNFVGNINKEKYIGYIQQYPEIVNFIGPVSYKKAIKYCLESDILVLINGTNHFSDIHIPAKIFDYFAANKPILFIGDGVTKKIIENTRTGLCSSHNPQNISDTLYKLLENKNNYRGYIEEFSSKNKAKEFVSIFNKISKHEFNKCN